MQSLINLTKIASQKKENDFNQEILKETTHSYRFQKDYSTAGSQVVSKLSTGAARRCLTSQIGRDEVLSP